jgi:hypothetical protein
VKLWQSQGLYYLLAVFPTITGSIYTPLKMLRAETSKIYHLAWTDVDQGFYPHVVGFPSQKSNAPWMLNATGGGAVLICPSQLFKRGWWRFWHCFFPCKRVVPFDKIFTSASIYKLGRRLIDAA